MPVSEARKRANAKWDKTNMTTVGVRVTRTLADSFTEACNKLGQTKGEVLRKAILDSIKKVSNEEKEEH